MFAHDKYGKHVLIKATGGAAVIDGAPIEVDYGAGRPARIDGTVGGTIAVEVESRVSKQVRGGVLDLICHRYPKKLLILLPVHMSNPPLAAEQSRNILQRFCLENRFRVVVLKGSGKCDQLESDAKVVAGALRDLGAVL